MISNDPKIRALMHENAIEKLAKMKMVTIQEAKDLVSEMSFGEYYALIEATLPAPTNSFSTMKPTYPNPKQVTQTNIPHQTDAFNDPQTGQGVATDKVVDPKDVDQVQQEDISSPSGDTIGPNSSSVSSTNTPASNDTSTQSGTSAIKSLWPGKGSPAQVGMTVGLKGPNNVPVPGQITQVDNAAKGAKVRNPTTGQEQWSNLDELQPFMANGQAQSQPAAPESPASANIQQMAEDEELSRLLELAGLKETCSAGATSSGSIATAPVAMGGMRKRMPAEGAGLKKEYTPKEAPKTIIGDTKPNQASGQLSANLAATGKPAAGRSNNGRKRR